MKFNPLSRRMFLVAGGQAALSIPLLTSLLPREAQAASGQAPLRFVSVNNWNSPNEPTFFGAMKSSAVPFTKTAGNQLIDTVSSRALKDISGNLSYILAPFSNLKSKLTVLRGLDIYASEGGAHPTSFALGATGFFDSNARNPVSKQVSVDTLIAQKAFASGTPSQNRNVLLSPLWVGGGGSQGQWNQQTFSATYVANPSDAVHLVTRDSSVSDTATLLSRLFASTAGTQTAPKVDRRNLLNQVFADYKSVQNNKRLGADDRRKLDAYLSLITEIETNIDAPSGGSCKSPALESELSPPEVARNNGESNSDYFARKKALTNDWGAKMSYAASQIRIRNHIKVLAAALACDATRVGSLSFNNVGSHTFHHSSNMQSKTETSNSDAADYFRSHQAMASNVAALMTTLDSMTEGSGTLLDHSIVYWNQQYGCVESSGGGHSRSNFPVFIGGGANGLLRMGQYIDYQIANPDGGFRGLPLNNLLVTFMNCFGLGSSNYETVAGAGYGSYDTTAATTLPPGVISSSGRRSPLPYLYTGSAVG